MKNLKRFFLAVPSIVEIEGAEPLPQVRRVFRRIVIFVVAVQALLLGLWCVQVRTDPPL